LDHERAGHGQEMRPERMWRRRSFGAPPLAEPLNRSVNHAGLRRPARLVRLA
jgi:hypothetical protein